MHNEYLKKWRTENNNGNGFAVGDADMSPKQAADVEGFTRLISLVGVIYATKIIEAIEEAPHFSWCSKMALTNVAIDAVRAGVDRLLILNLVLENPKKLAFTHTDHLLGCKANAQIKQGLADVMALRLAEVEERQ